jgi:hypothetical protein
MTLNKRQSAIMIIKDKNNLRTELQQIRNIPIVDKYKYLGVIINEKWNLDDHYSKLKKKSVLLDQKCSLFLGKVRLSSAKIVSKYLSARYSITCPAYYTTAGLVTKKDFIDSGEHRSSQSSD